MSYPKPKIPSWFNTYISENNDTMIVLPAQNDTHLGDINDFYVIPTIIGTHLDTGIISNDLSQEGDKNYEIEFKSERITYMN